MLQTMQEYEVTVGAKTYPLPLPFHVFATQNPIEMEGTYVLPEAQADRFMFSIHCGYPTNEEEELVVRNTTGTQVPELTPVLERPRDRRNPEAGAGHADLGRSGALRGPAGGLDPARRIPRRRAYVKEFVRWGASPRASQYLVLGAKARAAVQGRLCADYEGVQIGRPPGAAAPHHHQLQRAGPESHRAATSSRGCSPTCKPPQVPSEAGPNA